MMEPKIWTFFYGSYMNFDVLKEATRVPEQWYVARLNGFDIRIEPRANLVRSDQYCVYGILAAATHSELSRLYAHAQDVLGETYLPEAVLVETGAGDAASLGQTGVCLRPALCYLCPSMAPRPADPNYVRRILKPAREFGFPDWYLQRLESYLV